MKKRSMSAWPIAVRSVSLSVLLASPIFALTDPIRTASGPVSGSGSNGVM